MIVASVNDYYEIVALLLIVGGAKSDILNNSRLSARQECFSAGRVRDGESPLKSEYVFQFCVDAKTVCILYGSELTIRMGMKSS